MEIKKRLENLILNSLLSKEDKDLWISYLEHLTEEQMKTLTTEMENNPIIIKQLNNQLKELTEAFNSNDKERFYKILNLAKNDIYKQGLDKV